VNTIPHDSTWLRQPACAGRYRPWLRDTGSLTRRIQERCAAFSVKLLFQGLRRPNRDEGFVFDDAGRSRVLVREVALVCGATPVVYAHSVVRPADLHGAWRAVLRLGSRPLGAALFADARIRRYPLRQKKLARGHELHARVRALLPDPAPVLWARRSLFVLHASPILVTEVFLPGVLAL